jgi:hypothetical protein
LGVDDDDWLPGGIEVDEVTWWTYKKRVEITIMLS